MGRNADETRLIDVLRKNGGKTVMLGVKSSFFYIGPCEEALSDMDRIGLMAKLCIALSTKRHVSKSAVTRARCDIGSRRVVRSYVRNADSGGDELVVLVEGSEFGAFWTRAEYLACRQSLLDAIGDTQ